MSDFQDSAPGSYLDPINQAFLNKATGPGSEKFENLSVAEFHKLFEQLQEHKPIPGVSVTEVDVPFNQEGIENVKTFLFKPEEKENDRLSAVFYLHGGGWIAGR